MDTFSEFKHFIQTTFSHPLYQKINPHDRNCRGASRELGGKYKKKKVNKK